MAFRDLETSNVRELKGTFGGEGVECTKPLGYAYIQHRFSVHSELLKLSLFKSITEQYSLMAATC
jgi:hypothetical protein